jgi:hypothetical protein
LTNLLCHVGGMLALDDGRLQVELNDIVRALEDVIEDFRRRLPQQLVQHLDQAALGHRRCRGQRRIRGAYLGCDR